MKATGIVRRIDDLGSVVNQGVSAPIRTPEVESAPRFRVSPVMTTSIPLRIYLNISTSENGEN
mgnify:CR=1 FL=1